MVEDKIDEEIGVLSAKVQRIRDATKRKTLQFATGVITMFISYRLFIIWNDSD